MRTRTGSTNIMSNSVFRSRFPLLAALITILAAWVFMLLYLTGAQHILQCRMTNLNTELALKSPTLGKAVICAIESSSEALESVVPQLLPLLGDQSETTKPERPNMFNKREPIVATVGSFAMSAVRKATPSGANVEPIVEALVSFANRVKPRSFKLYERQEEQERPSTNTAKLQLNLLEKEYVRAGFSQQIADALALHANEITNDNFWRMYENPSLDYPDWINAKLIDPLAKDKLNYPILTVAQQIDSLAKGKSAAAKTFMAKFAAEQEAELAMPPRITPLRTLPAPAESDSASKASVSSSKIAQRVGWAGYLHEDTVRAPEGWLTIAPEKLHSCADTLPLMCIAKPAPDSAPITWQQLDKQDKYGRFWGIVDSRVALTGPVQGTQLTSRHAANAMCKKQLGEEWRLAYREDSEPEKLSPKDWRLALYRYKEREVITARASNETAFKDTFYWFAVNDAASNCWN
jgi:hypothetical protein